MSERYTDWFPMSVNPARPGVYQVDFWRDGSSASYSKFDGKHWYLCFGGGDALISGEESIRSASNCRLKRQDSMRPLGGWRGLAEQPKEVAQ